MTKIWYSQPLSIQWAAYEKNFKKNKESVRQFFQRNNRLILTNPYLSPQKRQINAFILDLWAADANKQFLHLYFVDKSLRNFLERIKLPDLNGIIEYIKENGFSSNQKALLPNGKPVNISSDKTDYFHFGIHVPYEKKDRGYAFGLMVIENREAVLVWAIGKDQGWCPLNKYKDLLKDESKDSIEIIRIIQLAINTIAYMNTFPGCVVDGVPKIIKEQSFHKGNSFILEISEKVVESFEESENGKMVSPHFRRGHFRRLTAQRYTKMRGKIIFVRETMVNGKAKTVYTSDDIEEMEENDCI